MAPSSNIRRFELCVTGGLLVAVALSAAGLYYGWSTARARNRRLSEAILWTNASVIRQMVRQGADPNTRAHPGRTILMAAAETGDLALMQEALGWKNPVNATDGGGRTALHHAIHAGAKLQAIGLLMENGADSRAPSTAGHTPLHIAAAVGHVDAMRLLIKSGVDVNTQVNGGVTPLSMAVSSGKYESVRFLLSQGADVYRKSSGGQSALDVARDRRDRFRRALGGRSTARRGDAGWEAPGRIVRLLEQQLN